MPPLPSHPAGPEVGLVNLELPALSPRLGNRCQQYLVPELIVPAVHRVAVHTDNFRTRRRRYVRTKASDNLPVFLCT